MQDATDCVLLKIFSHFEIKELVKCSFVCKRWQRVANDSSLWKQVDLRPFRWKLDETVILLLVNSKFKPFLRSINLSGFSLASTIFVELHNHCPNLKSLILENTTFNGFYDSSNQNTFPRQLDCLDIRYSTGDDDAFRLIASNISNLQMFGVNNAIISNANQVDLFRSLSKVQVLDFSYCNALFNPALILIGTFCTNLMSLSFFHCNNISGSGLDWIVKNCKRLKSLCISGTSMTDNSLIVCDWRKSILEELDISWCRNITEAGLKTILPHLINLKYLRLCSCGFGHALTDDVLRVLSDERYQKLQFIDFSYSREVTNNGVAKLIQTLPVLKQIRVSCCKNLTAELINKSISDKNVLILASFHNEDPRYFSLPQPTIHFVTEDSFTDDNRWHSFQNQLTKYWG